MRQTAAAVLLFLAACGPDTPEPNTLTASEWKERMVSDCDEWLHEIPPEQIQLGHAVCDRVDVADGSEANWNCMGACMSCVLQNDENEQRALCYQEDVAFYGCTLECYPPVA